MDLGKDGGAPFVLWWPVVVRQTPPVDLGNGCGAPFLLWWPVVIRQTPPPVDLGGGGGAPFVLWLPVVIGRTLPTDLRDENGASFVLRELPNPSSALRQEPGAGATGGEGSGDVVMSCTTPILVNRPTA